MKATASTTTLLVLGGVGPDRTQESIDLFNQLLENGSEKISDPAYDVMIDVLKSLN